MNYLRKTDKKKKGALKSKKIVIPVKEEKVVEAKEETKAESNETNDSELSWDEIMNILRGDDDDNGEA